MVKRAKQSLIFLGIVKQMNHASERENCFSRGQARLVFPVRCVSSREAIFVRARVVHSLYCTSDKIRDCSWSICCQERSNFCLQFYIFFLLSEATITVDSKEFTLQKSMIREIKRYQKEVHGKWPPAAA